MPPYPIQDLPNLPEAMDLTNAELTLNQGVNFSDFSSVLPPKPSVSGSAGGFHDAHTHSSEEWELWKTTIARLYVDEKLPLQSKTGKKSVMKVMKEEHGFFATWVQFHLLS